MLNTNKLTVDIQCKKCNKLINIPYNQDAVNKWKAGALIQDVMPNLNADQRELLISGICGPCYDQMFSEE